MTKTMPWIYVVSLILLLAAGCGKPIHSEVILCNGTLVSNDRLLGQRIGGDSTRLVSLDFGPATAASARFAKGGKKGIQTGNGKQLVQYSFHDLVLGEHFNIRIWRHDSNQGAYLRAVCPSGPQPKYEWLLRKSTEKAEAGWHLMILDITINSKMAGKDLLLELHPKEGDSLAWFDELRIERMDRIYIDSHHRKGMLKDARNGQQYPIVQIAGNWWMAKDLAWGQNKGRYTQDEALSAVPKGWHLPTDEEWKALELVLGVPEEALNSTGGRGKNLSFRMLEGGDSGLEIEPALENKAHMYWTSSTASDSTCWARWLPRQTGIGRQVAKRAQKMQVRAVMDK